MSDAFPYWRLDRVLTQLDALADALGERWDDFEFDALASARSLIREWPGWDNDSRSKTGAA